MVNSPPKECFKRFDLLAFSWVLCETAGKQIERGNNNEDNERYQGQYNRQKEAEYTRKNGKYR